MIDERSARARASGRSALPFSLTATGSVVEGSGDATADSVRLVLEVAPGERPLRPEFGCRVHEMAAVESPHDLQVASALVEEALERWLPWIGLERADVRAAVGRELLVVLRLGGAPELCVNVSLRTQAAAAVNAPSAVEPGGGV